MRRLFFLALFVFPAILYGQSKHMSDTLRIDEIVVRSSSKSSLLGGFRDITIDAVQLKDYQLFDISRVLAEQTPLYIKNYGPGAIATTSFRGTGANHTQLLWNDISINSPMLGQADLSLIPASFTDEIRILNGAASMSLGGGGLGGTVNFGTKPEWKDGTLLYLNAGAGSFSSYSGSLKMRTGSSRFQSVTRGYFNSSENNFRYLNDVAYANPVYEQRLNAALSKQDIMQEFYFRIGNSVTSANIWFSNSSRQLPSNILTVPEPGAETQLDRSLRAIISHEREGKASLDLTAALMSDYLHYVNRTISINSINHSNILYLRAGIGTSIGSSRIKIVLNNETDMVSSVNYSTYRSRNISTLTISERSIVGKRLGLSFLARELMNDGKLLIPDLSAGADYVVFTEHEGILRLNFARNSKIPSMNDLYWNPGGNPLLKNEYSYSGELSFSIKEKLGLFDIAPELTAYSSLIDDMIQWVPVSGSIWEPRNIARVNSSGAETALSIGYTGRYSSAKLKLQYTRNLAYDVSVPDKVSKKQIVYVPCDMFVSSFRFDYRNASISVINDFTGKRFTEADNSAFLPAYFVTGLVAGYNIRKEDIMINLSVRADNLFNARYEAIAFYPMPGRSFVASVSITFNNSK